MRTLTQHATDEIRRWILDGSIGLGEPLSESLLAARFGYSKTPIREALLQLKKEGLVSIRPQTGSFVFDIDARGIEDLGTMREILETAALDRAMTAGAARLGADLTEICGHMRAAVAAGDHTGCRDLDTAFHETMFHLAGNPCLLECYRTYAARAIAVGSCLGTDQHHCRARLKEHEQIAGLIVLGERAAATQALVAHIRTTTASYIDSLARRQSRRRYQQVPSADR
ncbi:GntR family transcriptional regulator [Tepidamorphus gemmatus]|uniref:GntR family transcriptional regulator n=1 Tax=Tepidamorphus gemmatus TaxID=747076 RepID=A0A4R3MAM7_9HYPH|nr:GntR family transcriptional regulator [Tepidamorphus gemmatus]TCT10641.1 GntR family transcriptional regulator [Tepidamorphus gemmatus]